MNLHLNLTIFICIACLILKIRIKNTDSDLKIQRWFDSWSFENLVLSNYSYWRNVFHTIPKILKAVIVSKEHISKYWKFPSKCFFIQDFLVYDIWKDEKVCRVTITLGKNCIIYDTSPYTLYTLIGTDIEEDNDRVLIIVINWCSCWYMAAEL